MSTRPNVVWLTLESVRADHTSVHGYDRDTTPNVRQMAEADDGVAFDDCISQSLWTPASSASILTGTYLFRHEVGIEGTGERHLPDDLETLPQLLGREGYRTACISPNAYLSTANGLDRGFERFRWLAINDPADLLSEFRDPEMRRPLLEYFARLNTYGPGPALDGRKHNATFIMQRIVQRWIRELSAGPDPFFVYAHVPNPHHAYTPPEKYAERFLDDTSLSAEEAIDLSLDIFSGDEMERCIAEGCPLSRDELAALEGLYDAEIAYADEFVGHVVESALDRDDDTIVVVTGDHGDLFAERGMLGHNIVLDDGLTRVPLVIYGLDGIEDAADGPVQHIDVTRTIAETIGVSSEQFQGRNLTDGPGEYAITQRGWPDFDRFYEHNPEFDISRYHESPMTAIRAEEYKLVKSEGRLELHALPDESCDVADEHPDVVERLEAKLDRRVAEMRAPNAEDRVEAEFTDEMERQLADLGYL